MAVALILNRLGFLRVDGWVPLIKDEHAWRHHLVVLFDNRYWFVKGHARLGIKMGDVPPSHDSPRIRMDKMAIIMEKMLTRCRRLDFAVEEIIPANLT